MNHRDCFVYVKEDARWYPARCEYWGEWQDKEMYTVEFTLPNVPSFVTVPTGFTAIRLPAVPHSIIRFDGGDA